MVRSLQLDVDDEPRRLGATSRANSVRFDESANQGQWSHASRNSMDLTSRTSTVLPGLGHPLFERTASHKSDGRHSSAGQSAFSGRANSLGLESIGGLSTAPMQPPGLAPGLFILGSVPAIIRCWLTTNFKSNALLYAAICTGSYKSFLDARLIEELDLSDRISQDINGDYKIKIPMYLPEAIPHLSSPRSGSPAPQLPTITVDFTIVDYGEHHAESKSIRIFIGSDLLRAHNGDIMFSTNTLSTFDDERTKLSIPLVRPENEASFKNLYITSGTPASYGVKAGYPESKSDSTPKSSLAASSVDNDVIHPVSGLEQAAKVGDTSTSALSRLNNTADPDHSDASSSEPKQTVKVPDHDRKPSLSRLSTDQRPEDKDVGELSSSITSGSHTSSSPAIWNNSWRREGNPSQTAANDWANISRGSNRATFSSRTGRDSGIKVLKPTRQLSRTSNVPQSASPTVTGQSRFFDDGKRRNGEGGAPRASTMPEPPADLQKRATSVDLSSKAGSKENASSASKPRSVNPIGGASAFGWLNSGSEGK